jgi:hypothetical protein
MSVGDPKHNHKRRDDSVRSETVMVESSKKEWWPCESLSKKFLVYFLYLVSE